jgi:hypothetical protein
MSTNEPLDPNQPAEPGLDEPVSNPDEEADDADYEGEPDGGDEYMGAEIDEFASQAFPEGGMEEPA